MTEVRGTTGVDRRACRALIVAVWLVAMVVAVFAVAPGASAQGASLCVSPPAGAITGTNGGEVLTGTPGDDVIFGFGGDDTIIGGGGNDIICGGDGNDSIWGQAGNDIIEGNAGNDRIRGGDGNDDLFGLADNDDLAGGRGDDYVDGGDGVDNVRGGTGNDIVLGGPGNDARVSGNGGEDEVDGGTGNDLLLGGPRPDTMVGGTGDDILRGLGGADTMWGGPGDDELYGGKQQDRLLDGGPDTDLCTGGGNLTQPGAVVNCEDQLNYVDADGAEVIGRPVEEPVDPPRQTRYAFDDGLVLKPTAGTTATRNADGTETLSGPMLMESAAGDLPTTAASLVVRPNEFSFFGGVNLEGGGIDLQLPSGGVFDEIVSQVISTNLLMVKTGSQLRHTGAPLESDRSYFVLDLTGRGAAMSTLFGDDDDEVALPSGISVGGSGNAYLIVDPTDPFIFIGGTLCQFSFSVTVSEPDPDDDVDSCGLGFSLNGRIPHAESSLLADQAGHVYLRGTVPIYKGLSLTGEVVVGIDELGVDVTADGAFDLGLKFFRSAPVDFSIPVGGGVVQLSSSQFARGAIGVDMILAIDGAGGTPESFEVPVLEVPISLPSSNESTIDAALYFENRGTFDAPSYVLYDAASFVSLSSSFSMRSSTLGGEALAESTQTGTLDITADGIRVTATQSGNLHPAVQVSGTVTVDAYLSWTDVSTSYLQFDGTFEVFDIEIGEGTARIDSSGFTVRGRIDAGGVVTIDIAGAINANPFLEGTVAVRIDTSEALTAAANALGEARADLNATRADVQQGLEDASSAFRDAESAVASARREVDSLRNEIRRLDGVIADLNHEIATCSGFLCELAPGAELLVVEGQRAGVVAALETANGVLSGAEALLASIRQGIIEQVDANVFVDIAEDTLVAAQDLVNEVNDVLPRMVIAGNLNARVDRSGLSASFSGQGCISGSCSTISGTVSITSSGIEVCMAVPGISETVCGRV